MPVSTIIGTHMGRLVDDHAREVRAAKNARNRNRVHPKGAVHGLAMPASAETLRRQWEGRAR